MQRLTKRIHNFLRGVENNEQIAINEARSAICRMLQQTDDQTIRRIMLEISEDSRRQVAEYADLN